MIFVNYLKKLNSTKYIALPLFAIKTYTFYKRALHSEKNTNKKCYIPNVSSLDCIV